VVIDVTILEAVIKHVEINILVAIDVEMIGDQ
jgi:hypothetical protein